MAEIESLELQITGNSKSAVDGLNALISTLDTLSTKTKGGLGLSTLATNIGKLATETSKLDSSGEKLKSLADGLRALSNVGNVKVSASVANQITSVGNAIRSLSGLDLTAPRELAIGLAPLETLSSFNLGSFWKQIEKLPELVEKLNGIDLAAFSAKIKQVADSIRPLADEMQKVSNGFAAFPDKIKKYVESSSQVPAVNAKTGKSFGQIVTNALKSVISFRVILSSVKKWINASTAYNENMNLFSVSLGEYADKAMKYANTVERVLGIDPSEWIRNQGVFMTLGKGFGVASDRAYIMSQNLTQLAYDLSSFANIGVEEATNKLKSGFSGELEPLRNLGYDLSQAKLSAIALSLGIDKSVSSMTQAEKAELRYYAIMTQLTDAHGDMARTLNEPANQLRVLKAQFNMLSRSLGNVFIPALNKALPYIIAAAKVLRILVDAVASLVGYELPEVGDYATVGSDVASGFEEANEEVAKMKKMLLGIDELNVMSDTSSSESSDAIGGGFNFELPTLAEITDDAVNSKVDEIVDKMKEWLGIGDDINSWADLFNTKLGVILTTVGAIGAAILVWKAIEGIANVIDVFSKFKKTGTGKTDTTTPDVGGGGLSDTTTKLKNLVKDIGLVIVVIAEVAAASLLLVGAIWLLGLELEQVGIAWDPVIKNGETIAIAMGIGVGILAAVGLLTYGLGKAGKSLVTDMGIGIAVLAEIGVAAALFVAEIWAIGVGLEQVGIAWEPVIANGEGIATAIGVGTGVLVAIGAVTALLGVATTATGGALPLAIALGTAILLEMGIATGLFIAEIWAIGDGLNAVGEAWQPVLDNGETIRVGIETGTGILIAIGAATALLGAATIMTGAALPVAIGLGTAMLLEMGDAVEVFIDEMISLAEQLGDELAPVLADTNEVLPGLEKDMADYTDFMSGFAGEVVKYTLDNAIMNIAATIDTVIDFFTTDPITRMQREVNGQIGEFTALMLSLSIINPMIKKATKLVGVYKENMGSFEEATGGSGGLLGSIVSGAKGVVNGLIGMFEGMANGVIKCINALVNGLNKISFSIPDWVPEIGGEKFGFSLKTISEIKIPRLAEGGLVNSGQLFIANEAGPEIVANVGRKTAVMNNDQIVESVSRGVYQAVSSAMGQSGGTQVVEAKVNDKVLFEVVVNRNRQETMRTGYSPLLGGV